MILYILCGYFVYLCSLIGCLCEQFCGYLHFWMEELPVLVQFVSSPPPLCQSPLIQLAWNWGGCSANLENKGESSAILELMATNKDGRTENIAGFHSPFFTLSLNYNCLITHFMVMVVMRKVEAVITKGRCVCESEIG